jgi:hypothetical protein
MLRFAGPLAMLLAMLVPALGQAQALTEYAIQIGGLKVGSIVVTQTHSPKGYRREIEITTSGLVGLIRPVRYVAMSEGSESDDGYPVPSRYREFTDTGRRISSSELSFRSGLPVIESLSTEGRGASTPPVDPEQAVGAADPASILGLLLSDRPADLACDIDTHVFDGWRLTHVTLSKEGPDASRCSGHFRRVAGFDPEDIAERTDFAFTVLLSPVDERTVRTDEVWFETTLGKGKLKRR